MREWNDHPLHPLKSKLSIDQQQEIDLNVIVFYDTIIKYIELWEESFDGTSIFSWMILSRYPDWNVIEESYEYAVLRFGENLRNVISRDQLCDEYGLMRQFCMQNINQWLSNKTPCAEIWTAIFKEFRGKLVNMEKLVEFAFALPGTSTEAERNFSLIKNIWAENRGSMALNTVKAILNIQYNSDLSCKQFYDKVKDDKAMLQKVQSSKKYQ